MLTQVLASSGHGCYHASHAPIGSEFVEPCWRQQYSRLVLGFASIDAITADSSQLTASEADGVRPDLRQSDPYAKLRWIPWRPTAGQEAAGAARAVASTSLGRLPARRGRLGALNREATNPAAPAAVAPTPQRLLERITIRAICRAAAALDCRPGSPPRHHATEHKLVVTLVETACDCRLCLRSSKEPVHIGRRGKVAKNPPPTLRANAVS